MGQPPSIRERRRLVGAGAPACGNRNVQQAQIHAELAAMLVPMVEHDIAHETDTGRGHELTDVLEDLWEETTTFLSL